MTKPPKCPACNGQGFTRWKGEDGACDQCKGSGELVESNGCSSADGKQSSQDTFHHEASKHPLSFPTRG